jgi:hypothetical protein
MSKDPDDHPEFLEMDTARKRRWLGLTYYILFFLIVAGALVYIFVRFSGSFAVAVLLVVFMIGYMLIMGYAAGKNIDNRDQR